MTFFFHVKKLKYTNFCLFVCFVLFFEIHKFKAEVTKLNIGALDYKVCFSLKALCTLIFYQHIEFFAGWILQNWWPLACFIIYSYSPTTYLFSFLILVYFCWFTYRIQLFLFILFPSILQRLSPHSTILINLFLVQNGSVLMRNSNISS